MGFILQYIEKTGFRRESEEIRFKNSCSYSIDIIDSFIPELKRYITRFSNYKKDPFGYKALIDQFVNQLKLVDFHYLNFVGELNIRQNEYKSPYNIHKDIIKEKLDYMLQKKKEYRAEFESIYDNFKRITKGQNFPRRNEILGLMRKAFDFDSSKYYQKNMVHDIQ